MNVLDRLHERPLLADGAMGTLIYALGVDFEQCFELLNVTQPELIRGIHRAYAAAGADIIETNTFGGNRYRLEQWGLAERVVELNTQAVVLARSAAAEVSDGVHRTVFVGASLGPTGLNLEPLGSLKLTDAYDAFHEQIMAIAQAGADLLMFETFSDLNEIEQAIRAARAVEQTVGRSLPIVAHMTFNRDGRTLFGNTPEQVAQRLMTFGADVVGANCSTGPRGVFDVVAAMQLVRNAENEELRIENEERPSLAVSQFSILHFPFFSAIPNAGFPEQQGGRLMYPATPEYFANYVHRFIDAGVRLMGGCCGTTPEHTRAMRLALDAHLKAQQTSPDGQAIASGRDVARDAFITFPGAAVSPSATATAADPFGTQTTLKTALDAKQFVITVEVEPPKSVDTGGLEDTARMLREAGATVLDISDMPMARMRMSGLAAAHRVQLGANIETVLHFPVRGRNLLRVQGDLLAAHALNLRNLFVTMGDPASIGDFPTASDQHDIVPTGLVQLIKTKFNAGQDSSGASIGKACSFVVGVAANLTPQDFDKEAKLLKKKIDFGADFALTQPVFDVEVARQFLDYYASVYGPLPLPVLMGVLPLASARHAEFLRNEVPGMMMPEAVVKRLESVGTKTRTEGALIAGEIVAALRDKVQGIYIIPAFGRYDIAARVIREMGR